MANRLATAEWTYPEDVADNLPYREGRFWLGRSLDEGSTPIGHNDDRHICLVSGTRGGKGTTTIIPNLCLWPGSVVVIDPKGENASVTAARRGAGSENCEGMGQTVHVLDPYNVTAVDDSVRSRFNPLDALDPDSPHCMRNAERIAAALVPPSKAEEKFWENGARRLISGLILHVLTAPEYEGRRNLITVRELTFRGDIETIRLLREEGHDDIPSGHDLLWAGMTENEAFGGYVAGIGERYRGQAHNAPKQWEGVLDEAVNATGFINNPGMAECLSTSDFELSDLKTDPAGVSLYLSIPQRFMTEDFRWLRMVIALITTEMEAVSGLPATGHRILMCLDEFAGLKHMEVIENAVAQMAGYGLKMLIVLQNLTQLKKHYEHSWETFLGNSGLKIFYAVQDHFTRDYVSKLVGETERVREVRSLNESVGRTESHSETETESYSRGVTNSETESLSHSRSTSESESHSRSHSRSRSQTHGRNSSTSQSRSQNYGQSYRPGLLFDNITSRNRGNGHSRSQTQGESRSWTDGTADGETHGRTTGRTQGETHGRSSTRGVSTTEGTSTSQGTSHGRSRNVGRGASETVHRVPLVAPHEVGLQFARVDDQTDPRYPGLALVMASGQQPIILRKTNYFGDPAFRDLFDPHPDHSHLFQPWRSVKISPPQEVYLDYLALDETLEIRSFLQPGSFAQKGQPYLTLTTSSTDQPDCVLQLPVSGRVEDIGDELLSDNNKPVLYETSEHRSGPVFDTDGVLEILSQDEVDEAIREDNEARLREACQTKRGRYEGIQILSGGIDLWIQENLKQDLSLYYAASGLLVIGLAGSFISSWFHIATVLAFMSLFGNGLDEDTSEIQWSKFDSLLPAGIIFLGLFSSWFLVLALVFMAGYIGWVRSKETRGLNKRQQAKDRSRKKYQRIIDRCPV